MSGSTLKMRFSLDLYLTATYRKRLFSVYSGIVLSLNRFQSLFALPFSLSVHVLCNTVQTSSLSPWKREEEEQHFEGRALGTRDAHTGWRWSWQEMRWTPSCPHPWDRCRPKSSFAGNRFPDPWSERDEWAGHCESWLAEWDQHRTEMINLKLGERWGKKFISRFISKI